MTGLDGSEATLDQEQQLVLQAIYDRFRDRGEWPTFISIDRPLRRGHGMDTRAVFNLIPDLFVVKPRQTMGPTDTDQLILRLPGIAACSGGREDAERFVRCLRWFAEQEVAFAPPPGSEDAMPRITSDDVAVFLGLRRDDPGYESSLQRLYAMLRLDRWGTGGTASNDDGWVVDLAPDIWRFRDVQTVDDVIRVREEWTGEAKAAATQFPSPVQLAFPRNVVARSLRQERTQPGSSGRVTYVDQQIVDAIQAKVGGSAYDVTKLLALIEELNADHAAGHTYGAHALLRAILDHIPPILGQPHFAAVVNNYPWQRSDKDYLRQLLNCKTQADDALHRQISPKPCVLRFTDLPASVCINRLLQECADRL